MKKLMVCILTSLMILNGFSYGVKGMRKGVRKSSYSSRSHSTSGHGIHGCGVANCHGSACSGGSRSTGGGLSFSQINQGIRTGCTVVRTVNSTVSTVDRHKLAQEELKYKQLRNEKITRELETGKTLIRPVEVKVIHDKPKYDTVCTGHFTDDDHTYVTCEDCNTNMSFENIKAYKNRCTNCNKTFTIIK